MSAYLNTHNLANGRALAAIDGQWRLVDGYMGAVRVPEVDLPGLALTIENGRFKLGNTEGLILTEGDPRSGFVDVIATSGPNRGQFVPGIFECSEDTLRVCYDLAGATRPTTFDAPPGTRRFVALYRRI